MKGSKTHLPDALYSADLLLAAAEELHQYGRQLARSADAAAKKATRPELSELATAALAQLPAKQRDDAAAVEELRQNLETLAGSAPAVSLTLAAAPPPSLRHELVRWCRDAIRPDILVNFHVNPDIAGGVIIRGANHTYDCSFRSGLLEHSDAFSKVLDRV